MPHRRLSSAPGRLFAVAVFAALAAVPAHADEIWVAPTGQTDLGGLTIGSGGAWPVTPLGAVRLAWAVPDDLQTFQGARLVLLPHAPGGAATLTVYVCAAQDASLAGGACAGPFAHPFTGTANRLLEVDISAGIAPRVGIPGATYLAVFAYTTPTTTTDHILGLRFVYEDTPPANVATLGANTFSGTQTAPAFVGDGSGLTNLPAGPPGPAGADGAAGPQGPPGPAGAGSTSRVYRWNVFNTYDQGWGWLFGNNPHLFGGVYPSNWTDAGGHAAMMSPDKEVLRTLFTQKGYPGANALVYANTRQQYSSTDGQVVAALLRIRNTTAAPINWPVSVAISSYGAWGEYASAALNGASVFMQTGSTVGQTFTFGVTLPPNRTSTLIVISTSGPFANMRSTTLAFVNNCLALPAGLELVDDLETATGGWEQ